MSDLSWMTNTTTSAVHLVYSEPSRVYSFARQEYVPARDTVCGRALRYLVADEGGAECARCLIVAETQRLKIPDRSEVQENAQ